jgi:hypothetical protein
MSLPTRPVRRVAGLVFALAAMISTAACGGGQTAPSPPGTTPPNRVTPGGDGDEVRGTLTPEQCKAAGGEVIGDIGDGAVHQRDYRCPQSAAPPIATIVTEPGQPIGVEGAVCCRP